MSVLALLLAAQTAAAADTVPPYLAFPEAGLDDPAAYQGYATRLFRDANGNAFQVYLNNRTGRVVHLWADAADESVGFTARDSAGRPAALTWASVGAAVAASGGTRAVAYRLEGTGGGGGGGTPAPLAIGLFLLGSMRVERDFQYQGRDSLPLDAPPFPQTELLELIDNLQRLEGAERRRELALLGAATVDDLRGRLEPRITMSQSDTAWVVSVEQPSFGGPNHLRLTLEGDARETTPALSPAGRTLTVRPRAGRLVRVTVRVTTDAPALTPLTRDELFSDDFRRFVDTVRADSTHPLRYRRLERELRGVELLSYREKLMAGLPNFATYFGRDMLMTALLMQPIWAPGTAEHVIASALRKLSSDGDVSHEEALGGQAVRENAAEYNRALDAYRSRAAAGDTAGARRQLEHARALLGNLQATRENYIMVDDDFQLPVVAARYLADPRVPTERKRRFLLTEQRLPRLATNLGYVARAAEPYVRDPAPTSLVSFPRAGEGRWISASWRDSRAGYGGGRFAMDVNVIWVPHALEAIGTILDALTQLGFAPAAIDSLAPAFRDEPLAGYIRDRASLRRAVAVWQGAERHFRVVMTGADTRERIAAKLRSLPPPERDYWDSLVQRNGLPPGPLRFLALALGGDGRPIPIVNTDPAMLLLLEPVGAARARELVDPILRPYPQGLFVDGLGPLVANDAYAGTDVWDAFRRDPYHSPSVVWGRDVNVLLAGLAAQLLAAPSPSPPVAGADVAVLRAAVRRIATAVEQAGLRNAELWSYRIEGGRLSPVRYGASSDVQLWNVTDLAVQYLLARLPQP